VLQQDLVVETTIDLPIQAAAERAVTSVLSAPDATARGVQQAALVALDGEGRVRAFVGGEDYADSQFDRAADARRQAGSSFKPFVYLTAMENGFTPDTPVIDEPIRIGNWEPHNFTGRYLGAITLQNAQIKLGEGKKKTSIPGVELQLTTGLQGKFGPIRFFIAGKRKPVNTTWE